ncbi:transmembrane protein, putative [Medicago truncatula]|uniref:Transmembrane protein, putative n=1 Tax=Medicago truncatula TaxID=3880 RepID=G7L8K9_MEDTR|nr:transmembrane protein, putative [Medicago truncatula]
MALGVQIIVIISVFGSLVVLYSILYVYKCVWDKVFLRVANASKWVKKATSSLLQILRKRPTHQNSSPSDPPKN